MGHSPNTYNQERIQVTNDRIWELRTLQNLSLRQIAKEMGIASPNTVHKRLQKMAAEYSRANLQKLDYYKTLQVKDLERVANAAWEAWVDSRKERILKTTSEFVVPETGEVKETVTKQYRPGDGNPVFLKEYRAALAEIRDILGIDAALKVEIGYKNDSEKVTAVDGFLDGLIPAATTGTSTSIN